jgi:hypothetical protein
VDVHDVGLGAAAGAAELVIPFGFPGQGTANAELQDHYLHHGKSVRVPIRIETLDERVAACGLPRADLIKIDVEGFELPVLQGAIKTLRAWKPSLFIEMHGLDPQRRVENVRQVVELVRGAGYGRPLHVETGQMIDGASAPPAEGHLWFS